MHILHIITGVIENKQLKGHTGLPVMIKWATGRTMGHVCSAPQIKTRSNPLQTRQAFVKLFASEIVLFLMRVPQLSKHIILFPHTEDPVL